MNKFFPALHSVRIELLLGLILFLTSMLVVVYQYGVWESSEERVQHKVLAIFSGDEPHYLEITSNIIHNHSIATDIFFKDSRDPDPDLPLPRYFTTNHICRSQHGVLASDGHCYSGHQPTLSVLLIPGYLAGGFVGSMLTMNLIFTLNGVLVYKFSSKFATARISFFSALIFSLGTMLFSFSGEIYTDLLAGFLLLLILYMFFYKQNTFFNTVCLGMLVGSMPFLKLAFVIFPTVLVPVIGLVLFRNGHKKELVVFLSVVAIFILSFLSYLLLVAPVENHSGLGGGNAAWLRSSLSESPEEIFSRTTKGLANLLFGSSYGLFVFSPLALLSLFGLKFLWSKNKLLTLTILIASSAFVLVHSFLIGYAASWTLPSRYVLPILPLLGIPLALLLDRYSKKPLLHILLVCMLYAGASFNILFTRILYGHPTPQMRFDIANQVYFGMAKIFPYVDTKDASTIANFWSSSGPYFWIFLIVLCSLLAVHTFWLKLKSFNQLRCTRS